MSGRRWNVDFNADRVDFGGLRLFIGSSDQGGKTITFVRSSLDDLSAGLLLKLKDRSNETQSIERPIFQESLVRLVADSAEAMFTGRGIHRYWSLVVSSRKSKSAIENDSKRVGVANLKVISSSIAFELVEHRLRDEDDSPTSIDWSIGPEWRIESGRKPEENSGESRTRLTSERHGTIDLISQAGAETALTETVIGTRIVHLLSPGGRRASNVTIRKKATLSYRLTIDVFESSSRGE